MELMEITSMGDFWKYLLETLKGNEFFQGGFILGLMTAVGMYLKKIPGLIWGRIERLIIYKVTIEQKSDLFNMLEYWLSQNHSTKYRNVQAFTSETPQDDDNEYKGHMLPSTSQNKIRTRGSVVYKQFEDIFYIKVNIFQRIRIDKRREKVEGARNFDNAHQDVYELGGLFGKRAIHKILDEAYHLYHDDILDISNPNVEIKRTDRDGDWMWGGQLIPKKLDNIIFSKKEEVMKDINEFLSNEQWYRKRGIPYRRGYLLYGPPGNGKTTFIMSLTKHLNMNLRYLNLNDMRDGSLHRAFSTIAKNSVLVIEDIDAAVNDRNMEKEGFSFSTLLNCLDGAYSKENIIVIFTTNHIEKLDSALIRPGRIDVRVNMTNPIDSDVEKYLSLFYQRDIKIPEGYKCKDISMASIQNTCMQNIDSWSDTLYSITEPVDATKGISGDDVKLKVSSFQL